MPVSEVFFSRTLEQPERQVISSGKIDYIVVDKRLSRGLPVIGYYFEGTEPEAFTREVPISSDSLAKFLRDPEIDRIFDNGVIVIYDSSDVEAR